MSIAGRFEEALTSVTEDGLDGPELLPTRLSRAITKMLPVDGAGISLSGVDGRRIPLGASSEDAAVAERLQFTVGAGPNQQVSCLEIVPVCCPEECCRAVFRADVDVGVLIQQGANLLLVLVPGNGADDALSDSGIRYRLI